MNTDIIKMAGFSIIQISDTCIKIYAEDLMAIMPSSGNTIMIMNRKI